jgi:hypothetical protein
MNEMAWLAHEQEEDAQQWEWQMMLEQQQQEELEHEKAFTFDGRPKSKGNSLFK